MWLCVNVVLGMDYVMVLMMWLLCTGLQLVCIGSMVCDGVCCDSVGS